MATFAARAVADDADERGARRFLTADWRDLVMLNYEVDPALLAARVPAGTTVDSWEGRTFVSVVGFRFLSTKVLGVAVPFHRDFEELNLRFYVRRDTPQGARRGVVFVKELVPRRAIAWIARSLYNENYVAHPMRHDVTYPTGVAEGSAVYQWHFRGRWNAVSVRFAGEASLPANASLEEFITEHYWGYVVQRDGSSIEYQVEHPRWRVWRASSATLDCDVAELYGTELARPLDGSSASAFIADGSAVVVRRGRPLS